MIRVDVDSLKSAINAQVAAEQPYVAGLVAAIRAHSPDTDRTGEIPDAFWQAVDVRALNLMVVPKRFGGLVATQTAMSRVVSFERVGYEDPGYAIALPGPGLSMPPILAMGNEALLDRVFARFHSDRPIWGSFAITEPHAGSEATAIRTYAEKTGDGYVLNGSKCFVTNGARSDYVIVFAMRSRTQGRLGMRAFLVETGTPGYSVLRTERMLGMKASQLTMLQFEDCRISEDNLLWREDLPRFSDALSAAQRSWDFMRPMLSSIIVGTCQRLLDELRRLLEGREDAGRRLPDDPRNLIARYQTRIDGCRMLALQAAWKYDRDIPMSRDASMAKAMSSSLAIELSECCHQIAGLEGAAGTGFFDKALRDCKAFDILEGTGDIQRNMICAYHLASRTH